VLKVLLPRMVRDFGEETAKAACKEAVSLGRLNEQVPTSPYVVRLVEAGSFEASCAGRPVELFWLALEYVHGGAAGTTLTERVAHSIRETGAAFDQARAAHAIDCLGRGLEAVHAVGVIHRDIKPDNVLCCSFGDDEIFKIADFGVARPAGVTATFSGGVVGTPGYSPPEVMGGSAAGMGPDTDVFSLAGVVFFLLTGEDYFAVGSIADALLRAQLPERRSLLDARSLDPDLRARPLACKAIDAALAQATSPRRGARQPSVAAFCASILPHLRTGSWRQRPPQRQRDSALDAREVRWTWLLRQRPSHDRVVRSVGWDGDGACLVATTTGLLFWDGTSLREAPSDRISDPRGVRFVRRLGPRKWLVACDEPLFAIYTEGGVSEVSRFPEDRIRVELFDGDIDYLAVAVGRSDEGLALLALAARRWLRPLPLEGVTSVTSLARVDDARWLLTGRAAAGAFAGMYSPVDWDIEPLPVPPVRALLACAGNADLHLGAVAGADGALLWFDGERLVDESVGGGDLSAAAVDPSGGGWVAGLGRILHRTVRNGRGTWRRASESTDLSAPIVSLFADVGSVTAMTADGAILEGRSGQ
jgi:hypothetical protein